MVTGQRVSGYARAAKAVRGLAGQAAKRRPETRDALLEAADWLAARDATPTPERAPDDWTCPECGCTNRVDDEGCWDCTSDRPTAPTPEGVVLGAKERWPGPDLTDSEAAALCQAFSLSLFNVNVAVRCIVAARLAAERAAHEGLRAAVEALLVKWADDGGPPGQRISARTARMDLRAALAAGEVSEAEHRCAAIGCTRGGDYLAYYDDDDDDGDYFCADHCGPNGGDDE